MSSETRSKKKELTLYIIMKVYNNGAGDTFGFLNYNSDRKEYEENPQGRGFELSNIYRNLETGDFEYLLTTVFAGVTIDERFSPADLNQQGISILAQKGYDVNPANLKCFTQVLQEDVNTFQQQYAPSYNHSYLGWDELEICGKCFKFRGIITDKTKSPNFTSVYEGNLDIRIPADHKKQLLGQVNVIKKYILGNYAMEAALAIGASAVVNGYISDEIHSQNIITHFVGDSSTGKTTAAQLAVSVACRPDLTSNTLMKSWDGTALSITARIKGNHGLPVAFDEISKFRGSDMSNVVYSLSDGRERDRCDKTGEVKKIGKYDCWKTTVISTGETSLLGRCSQNTGLAARAIELSCKFTNSAEEADNIKAAVNKYYGCIAPYLAKNILAMDKTEILAIHAAFREKYASQSKAKGLENRIGTNVAVILTAAELLNRCCKLTLNTDEMLKLFLEAEYIDNSSETLADRAYNYLINMVNANPHHFVVEKRSHNIANNKNELVEIPVSNTERWGKIEEEKGKILIILERAKILLKQGGFESDRVALKAMRDAGYLDHEDKRNTRNRKISKDDQKSCTVVILKIYDEDDETDSKPQKVFVPDTYSEQSSMEGCEDNKTAEYMRLKEKYDEPFRNF